MNDNSLHILLVEDSEDDAILLQNHLRYAYPRGYRLTWVSSYEEGLQSALSQDFDIYLVDYHLGVRDGLDLARNLLKQRPDAPPILILTGLDSEETNLLALQSGVSDCIFKNQITAPLLGRAIAYALARKESELALRESEIRHRTVLNSIAEGIITINSRGIMSSVNPAVTKMFGYDESELLDQPINLLMPEPYRAEHDDYLQRYMATGEVHILDTSREIMGQRKDGSLFPLEVLITEFEVGGSKYFSGIVRDISRRKQEEAELRLAATAFNTHAAIMITDADGTILRVNNAFTQITGYTAHDAIGKNPRILQSGIQSKEFYQHMWAQIVRDGVWEGEIWNRRKNGETYPEWMTITAVKSALGEVNHYIATFQDITERKEAQAIIEHQAYYDPLTELPNRRYLIDRLQQEVASARRRQIYGALLFLDLDHFKKLNDSLGHAAGDYLLTQVAKRLIRNVRTEDTVARLGGDEFVMLLPYLNQEASQAGITAQNIAEKIRLAISEPYCINDKQYTFSPSIGVALFPFGDESADDILKHADTAMYKAKEEGRNNFRFYHPSMQAVADARLTIEMELAQAIDRQELELYYQPQVSHRGDLIGVEALLRWNHPQRGLILPDQFIGIAEETNMIIHIGEWVLKTAIQQFLEWMTLGYFPESTYLSVNVSPRQFQHGEFVSTVKKIIRETEMVSEKLKLEITEILLLQDIDDTVSKMQQLRSLGVRFSIDDFGKGYSSLTYLKQLPLDQIKIDRSFVFGAAVDKNDAAIVETIITMAKHFKLDVIAEGVETQEVVDFLHSRDCLHYQGFLFSESLPGKQFLEYLQHTRQFPVEARLRK